MCPNQTANTFIYKIPAEINNPKTTLAPLSGSMGRMFVEKVLPEAKRMFVKNHDEAVDLMLKDKAAVLIAGYQVLIEAPWT